MPEPPPLQSTRPDRKARTECGRAARERLSRGQLGNLRDANSRADPVDILLAADEGRTKQLLPMKYGRMALSPFAFFRGTVSVMAADLAAEPNTGLHVQLCGDAHVQNLGWFETPDGRIVFDINDFDETFSGPWEWDVKRMAASLVVAGRDSRHSGSECREAVKEFAEAYCGCIKDLADVPVLVAARYQIHRLAAAAPVGAAFQQAKRASPMELLAKYTTKDGRRERIFVESPGDLWRVRGSERKAVMSGVISYLESLAPERKRLLEFFRPLDVAFKVVGTGSIGLRDYIVLLEGNGPKDPLFLQLKQEVTPAYSKHLKLETHSHQGRRVAEGSRRMQAVSDLLLGWTTIEGRHYLVRQLNDHKGKIDVTNLGGDGLRELGTVAGHLLARAHARSGDPLAISSYIGSPAKVIDGIARYGLGYAERAHSDYKLFKRALKDGRIQGHARTG